MPLTDLLLEPIRFNEVLKDSVTLVESEVAKKKGMAGMAIKTTFGLVRQMKPGLIEDVLTHLLPKFVEKLEPYHKHFTEGTWDNFATLLCSKTGEVANALLSVTDQRAEETQIVSLQKAYKKLRPAAQQHVQDAIPALAKILDKHLTNNR